MPLNISTNKIINNEVIANKFVDKFISLGNKVYSNTSYGTSNKIDAFDFIRSKRLFNILNENIGIGQCNNSCVKIHEKNNAWFDCCNINEKGICFDGENFRDLTKERSIIEEYRQFGWQHLRTENCRLYFEKVIPAIPNLTDIHAYFDTTSMLISDGIVAAEALNEWFLSIKAANPSYEGNLYIIPITSDARRFDERWLREIRYSYGGFTADTGVGVATAWASLAVLPPGFTTSSYIPPNDLIILSFIDETNSNYHGSVYPSFGIISDPPADRLQPTNDFNEDLAIFLSLHPNFDSFTQILYPIPKPDVLATYENVLTMIAAVKARLLSPLEITELNSFVDISLLETQNPYTVPLEDYNVKGIWNKYSPASEVFNSETFGQELSNILEFSSPIIQHTNILLPIKKLEESVFTLDNYWETININYKRCVNCMPFDEILNKLYKFAVN